MNSLDQLVLVIFVFGLLAVSFVIGSLVGIAVGWRWRRLVHGIVGGQAGAFVGSCIFGFLVGGYALRPTTGSTAVALVLIVLLATCSAWIVVYQAGDARPNAAGPDNWKAPGPDEISRNLGE
jgi:hypothetical protein